MKAVSQVAGAMLNKLADRAQAAGGAVVLDNKPKTFMALHVEWIGKDLLSVAHYGEQNGDLMRDPDMVFWRGPEEKVYPTNPLKDGFKKETLRSPKRNQDGSVSMRRWYPVSFRNDYVGSYREAVIFNDDGTIKGFRPKEQAQQAVFTTMWMRNIKYQQGV